MRRRRSTGPRGPTSRSARPRRRVAASKVRGQDARKVVYAANHKPVLAWESTVTRHREGRHADPQPRLHRRAHRQAARRTAADRDRHRHRQLALQRHRQPDHHPERLELDAHRRGARRPQDVRRHRDHQRERLPHRHPVQRHRRRLGHRHHLEQAERGGRRALRRGPHVGLLQEHLRPQRHPQQRCRCVLARALRQQLRERLLGRLVLLHDLRRRRFDPQAGRRHRRGRPRDVARRHRGHRRARLLRRRGRSQRVDLRRDGHDGGVLRQQRLRPR